MIKLIALDLDGTLLTDDKKITENTTEILRQAKDAGVYIVLCTGRPLFAIQPFIDHLGLRDQADYSITFNGSTVQKNDTGESLLAHSLSYEEVKIAHAEMTKLGLPLDVISMDTVIHLPAPFKEHMSEYERMNPLMKVEDSEIEMLDPTRVFNKMVVGLDQTYLDERIPKISDELHATFNIMKSRPDLLEIIHKKASKANGIAQLADYLGIKQSEVMAIGDEENDRSMIEYAGLGVVMENGTKSMKEIAQFVTKSNEDDGVAYAVEKFVLNKKKEGE